MPPHGASSAGEPDVAGDGGVGSGTAPESVLTLAIARRVRRRLRAAEEPDYSGLTMPKQDIPGRFPGERACVQWMVHLDEYNSYKPYARDINNILETCYRRGRANAGVQVNDRLYNVRFVGMVQESHDTGRLRHVIRTILPLRPESGHHDTGLPVEIDD